MADTYPCDCGHESETYIDCEDCKRRMCPACYETHEIKVAVDPSGAKLKVQLVEAFSWNCLSCGHLNVISVNRQADDEGNFDLSEEEEVKLREHLGIEPWEELPSSNELGGVVINIPYHVTCRHCQLSFGTLAPPLIGDDISLTDDDDEEPSDDGDDIVSGRDW
jgi:hypothetical protein